MAIGEGICAPRTGPGEPDGMGHVVQFYEADVFLVESAGDFLTDGVRTAEGTVVVATAHHREGYRKRLRAAGINVSLAEVSEQDLALDVADLLARAGTHLELARMRRMVEAAQQRDAFLAETSRILASSLDYQTTLGAIARLRCRSWPFRSSPTAARSE